MHSPHDTFVKASLKNLAIARDFIRAFVPEQIYSAIDINTLALADKELGFLGGALPGCSKHMSCHPWREIVSFS
jgi:hypothetical protein